jgi:hypothetical protein
VLNDYILNSEEYKSLPVNQNKYEWLKRENTQFDDFQIEYFLFLRFKFFYKILLTIFNTI